MAERTLWLLGFVLRVLNVCAILVEEFQMPLTFQHAKICEAFVHYAPGCLYLNPLYILHYVLQEVNFPLAVINFPSCPMVTQHALGCLQQFDPCVYYVPAHSV